MQDSEKHRFPNALRAGFFYDGDYNYYLLCQTEQLNLRTFQFEQDNIVMLESNQRDEIQLSIK